MTTNKYILLFFLLSVIWLNSCIDEFKPEVSKYENLLVVDGGISNEPPPYTIKLSRSSPINDNDYQAFTGCNLIIEDGNGNQEYLTEYEEGVYKTSTDGMQGEIGEKYKLIIQTPDGKRYESAYDILKASVHIESVEAEIETKNTNEADHTLLGYQFYLNTETPVPDTNYYMWKLVSTYHYQSDYLIRWYYDGQVKEFYPFDSLYDCYTTSSINNIYTYSTENASGKKLENFPLNFVSTDTRELSLRYSLMVKQLTLSKKAYIFWNALEEQNADQGSLYTQQPYQILGNMKNVDDDEEPVLGYFLVSSIDSLRVFVDRPDLTFYFPQCYIDEGNYDRYANMFLANPPVRDIYVILYDMKRAVPSQPCADCRMRGGTIVKPEFWED